MCSARARACASRGGVRACIAPTPTSGGAVGRCASRTCSRASRITARAPIKAEVPLHPACAIARSCSPHGGALLRACTTSTDPGIGRCNGAVQIAHMPAGLSHVRGPLPRPGCRCTRHVPLRARARLTAARCLCACTQGHRPLRLAVEFELNSKRRQLCDEPADRGLSSRNKAAWTDSRRRRGRDWDNFSGVFLLTLCAFLRVSSSRLCLGTAAANRKLTAPVNGEFLGFLGVSGTALIQGFWGLPEVRTFRNCE